VLRVLVTATTPSTETADDSSVTDDRELVCLSGLCDSRSGRCQCDTSFLILRTRVSGIAAAEVAERDMTLDDYINAFIASYVMAGLPDDGETLSFASREAIQLHMLARRYEVGTVLQVHGDHVRASHPKRAR